jgi:hypothetical protein
VETATVQIEEGTLSTRIQADPERRPGAIGILIGQAGWR